MPVEVYRPKQEQYREGNQKDALDTLAQALGIAASGYGIYTDYQKLQSMKENQKIAAENRGVSQEEIARKKAALERGQKGRMTESEYQDVLATQKFVEIAPPKQGEEMPTSTLKRFVIGENGVERPVILRQVKPVEMENRAAEGKADRQIKWDVESLKKEGRAEKIAMQKASKATAQKQLNSNQQFKMLPPEDQRTVMALAASRGNIEYVTGGIAANLETWDDPKATDEDRLQQGRQMLKLLNSLEGADAVGAEEAKRLMGKLEVAYGNFTNDNPTQFGRDLTGFRRDVENTLKTVQARQQNINKSIDKYYGRSSATQQPQPQQQQQSSLPKSRMSGSIMTQRQPMKASQLPDL